MFSEKNNYKLHSKNILIILGLIYLHKKSALSSSNTEESQSLCLMKIRMF